ncbi:MAG TPA: biopolymer transporter ExbD [Rhodoblastus sp.]|nr:biopolymer transporter ExbD [Rhodoblastus sp.]
MALNNPAPGGRFRPLSEINVTPMVDVMLVLLIVFMVTAPLLSAGMKVNLPQAKTARPLDPKEPIVVVIGKDGKIFVDTEAVAPEDLAAAVKLKMGDDLNRVVRLRGDRDASYGPVVAAMDELVGAGITHIAIVTQAAPQGTSNRSSGPPTPEKPK